MKYLFDRTVALIGLVLFSPLLLIVYIAVRLEQPGYSAFFTQLRVGKDGRLFSIYKFRTLDESVYADSLTTAVTGFRVTKVGGFLRKTKINELPQLWNVLVGDMSFVGPRPDVPGYADALKGDDREILQLRPGITGLATLKYRNEEEILAAQDNPLLYNDEVIFPDKVRINRHYLHHHSLVGDLHIILSTLTGFPITIP